LRAQLPLWTLFERSCGSNPLENLLQKIEAKQRIERFLPEWLSSREEQLAALNQTMGVCAAQNGLQHLL